MLVLKSIPLMVLALLSVTSPSLSAEPTAKMLADTCAACHGPGGVSSGPAVPSIAGLAKEYIVISFKDFRSGSRPSTIMGRIAKGYSELQVESLADYYSAKSFVPAQNTSDGAIVALGAEIHDRYCEECHENKATANTPKAPALAGQLKAYVIMSIKDFQSKDRFPPPKMKRKFKSVEAAYGQDGFDALVAFYASRKP